MYIKKWFSSFTRQSYTGQSCAGQSCAQQPAAKGEEGQSIVIIAFVLIGLLAFAGIAVDVGFVFARSSQLQAGVDAAALAGVTELSSGGLAEADNRAAQFLRANRIPISVTQTFVSRTELRPPGATEYSITATWPVELFFLRVIGLEEVNVTKSATAAYFPLADIFTSRRVEYGFIDTANQSIFGPRICTSYGDPFSPLTSRFAPGLYTWQYRIFIPPDYAHDVVRVEIFDPDSINQAQNTFTVLFSQAANNYDPVRFPLGGATMSCSTSGGADAQSNRYQPCVIQTGELAIVDEDESITIDQINPFWFVRIDENRGVGGGGGTDVCGRPGSYTPRYNTQTVYNLFYYAQGNDGRIQDFPIASYTGQVGDLGTLGGWRDNGNHQTDMRWVSPGGAQLPGQPVPVPTDFGSFEVNLNSDVPDILRDPATGARYIYLNITSISGASENGFDIWAGPPYADYSSDVNVRNIQMTNNPGGHFSDGVLVFAMGNLPMNSIHTRPVDIPLVYLGPELAGQQVFISLFDPDAGTQPPVAFFFDSIAFEAQDQGNRVGVNWNNTDWGFLFGDATDPNTDGRCFHVGVPGNNRCTNQWIDPPYALTIPGNISDCDYGVLDDLAPPPGQSPSAEYRQYLMNNCTPFYGGRLFSRYASAFADTYGWQIRLEGLPYLVR